MLSKPFYYFPPTSEVKGGTSSKKLSKRIQSSKQQLIHLVLVHSAVLKRKGKESERGKIPVCFIVEQILQFDVVQSRKLSQNERKF